MRLTPKHLEVLEFLTWQVRVATDAQIQQLLSSRFASRSSVARIMRQMANAGLIHRRRIVAAVPTVSVPLCSGSPGQEVPCVKNLAWRLHTRNERTLRQRVQVNWGSPLAASLTGGCSGWGRQPLQLDHDLGTTEMCLAESPALDFSESYIQSEDILRRGYFGVNRKFPDAVRVNASGRILCVLEYGGQYSRRRVEQFIRHWQHTAWEIW